MENLLYYCWILFFKSFLSYTSYNHRFSNIFFKLPTIFIKSQETIVITQAEVTFKVYVIVKSSNSSAKSKNCLKFEKMFEKESW